MENNDYSHLECPIARFSYLVQGKYKLRILWELKDEARRNSELLRALKVALQQEIQPKTLSRELRDLESKNLIARRDYHKVPPRVDYSLTEFGQSFIPVMLAICKWQESLAG